MKKLLSALLSLAILSTFAFFAVASGDSEKEAKEETTITTQAEENLDVDKTEGEKENKTENTGAISPEFKKMMDEYEAFFDEYCKFMKKYSANPSDTSLLSDYSNFMSKYATYMDAIEEVDEEDLNEAELAYYIEVTNRVSKKLMEVSGY